MIHDRPLEEHQAVIEHTGPMQQDGSSPKRLVRQPLHIRMNLTESQVDKITDAYVIALNAVRF